jgi:hypothetical protein
MINRTQTRLNAFFPTVLLRSHLCTLLVDPPPAPHALGLITHFVQFEEFAKPARPTFYNAFWKGTLALLSVTWHFIFYRHFVRCAGEDCSSGCLHCHSFEKLSDEFDVIFLKCTTRYRWSNMGNYCRSNLENHTIFLFSEGTQRLDGTISYVQASIVPQGSCVCTSADGTYLS